MIILIAMVTFSVPIIAILAGLLLPAIQQGREAARRMSCSSNVRQIGIALLNYEHAYRSFPPAYTVDIEGNKLHSWRTLLLPFMEQQALYDSINLSKPWNDPINARIADTSVSIYACPSLPIQKKFTTYKVVVDPSSAFPGNRSVRLREIHDGTANTLLVFESSRDTAVHWMAPEDASMAEFVSDGTGGNNRTVHFGGGHICVADCAVRFLPSETKETTRKALVTIDGGEAGGF